MRLRIRTPSRALTLTVPDDCTLHGLLEAIEGGLGGGCTDHLDLKFGYPLQALDRRCLDRPLTALGLCDASTLHLLPPARADAFAPAHAPAAPPPMALREIPDDNSCLFNAIAYVLEKGARTMAPQLRTRIPPPALIIPSCSVGVAEFILAHPERFDALVLGRAPQAYATWIQRRDTWGGAIELAVFSDLYGAEIASFDVQSGRMDLFGEGHGHPVRVYLQYTGIHYEAFAQAHGASEAGDVTVFSPQDTAVLAQVQELVLLAQAAHRFTDTHRFALRCEQCQQRLRGQYEAQQHAEATGHARFTEHQ